MERITKREFIQHTSKYIKPSEFILTNRGEPEYKVKIEVATSDYENVATTDEVATTNAVGFVLNKDRVEVNQYGCGCPKEVGFSLCRKHLRV